MADRTLTDPQIINAFAKMDQRISYCGQNTIQIGLYVEYLIQKLSILTNPDGSSLVNLDMEKEFQEFAAERAKEIDQEVEEIRNALQKNKKGLNLDDNSGQ